MSANTVYALSVLGELANGGVWDRVLGIHSSVDSAEAAAPRFPGWLRYAREWSTFDPGESWRAEGVVDFGGTGNAVTLVFVIEAYALDGHGREGVN